VNPRIVTVTAIAMPLVSVITPTYNRADFVLRAVRSVLGQTESDLELLVVDDGSTDHTATVLATITDPRVRVLCTTHVGVSRARNVALADSKGAWIAFLDDDDEWQRTYLQEQLAAARTTPEAVAVYCPAHAFDDDTGCFGEHTPWYGISGDLFAPMMRRGYPRPSATLVRRAALVDAGGFPPDLTVGEDCELFLRLALLGTYTYNPEPLLIRHVHGHDQLSTQWIRQRESYWIQASRLRVPIVRRGGYRAWATWLRWHVGEAELAAISTKPVAEKRAAARLAVRRLARQLPWSASAMVRPLVIAVAGPHLRSTLRRWRRSARRLAGSPSARGRPTAAPASGRLSRAGTRRAGRTHDRRPRHGREPSPTGSR
jgi:GT2 family glycosyltransferase